VPDNRPVIAFLTESSARPPWARIARWFGNGFAELGIPFDAVYLEGPRGMRESLRATEVRLGDVRARAATHLIANYLARRRPSLTLVSPAHLSPFAVVAGKLAGARVIPWEAAFLSAEITRLPPMLRLLPALRRVTYSMAPAIAAVSLDVADDARRDLGLFGRRKKYVVVPNPVDAAEIRKLARGAPDTTKGEAFRICMMSDLIQRKRVDVGIQAVAHVRHRLTRPTQLQIIGEGPLRGSLARLAHECGVADIVRFAGRLENPYPAVEAADVFLHPAELEGFGVAIVEALALGRPTIAVSGSGGPRQILANGAGVLLSDHDAGGVSDVLVELATREELRHALSKQARTRADEYAPRRIAAQVVRLNQELDAEAHAPRPR
jgi:glycosyltransferase involved in cell wall biosynthesis